MEILKEKLIQKLSDTHGFVTPAQAANLMLSVLKESLPDLEKMVDIGREILSQDNRITDSPIFAVEKLVKYPADSECTYDGYEWFNEHSQVIADNVLAARLDEKHNQGKSTGRWRKVYFNEVWEFSTGCFTERGCKNHLEINGHNLGKTRIYAHGSFRNDEYRSVRKFLIDLAGVAGEKNTTN